MKTTISLQGSVNNPDTIGNLATLPLNTANDSSLQYGQSNPQAGQVSTIPTKGHTSRRVITNASPTLDIDLQALQDIYGNVLNFTKIFIIYIKNRDAVTGSGCKVGGAGTGAWTAPFDGSQTAKIVVRASGEFFLSDPLTGLSVSVSSRMLRLFNDNASPTGPLTVDLYIVGG